ncbi:gibberellin-regulated protein 1-like [Beta vulgaris subsp. vulgaris]|uniref:gibberellin-regulated protein 1-like n=1 Tax=Beta vulgaris subsp. vulgaris TaxID=3555 RepID=UPI002036DBC6|nr:gibberellin-regulated protein 1-like [Beta vulgaris subsp. vulgaris]
MAISKLIIATLVLSFLLLHVVEAQEVIESNGPKRSLLGINCGASCVARCRLSRRPKLCHRACGTCCARCGCVPPGTSGNQEQCACYYNQTTHGGKRKCP